MSAWKAIGSAPKDGTKVLVAHDSGYVRIAYFGTFPDYGRKTWIGWGDGSPDFRIVRPRYWLPIPIVPANKQEGLAAEGEQGIAVIRDDTTPRQ